MLQSFNTIDENIYFTYDTKMENKLNYLKVEIMQKRKKQNYLDNKMQNVSGNK